MKERTMSIVFNSKFSELKEHNSSFDAGVLQVAYTGKNPNNTFISRETFELCMPSIYNVPIVCNYDRDTDQIGGHDMEIVKRDDGLVKLVNITHPVGVIPESANYWFEEVVEEDGSIHEYLCVDALLWKRQEAYEKIKNDGITDESMEIDIKESRMVDGVYHIDRFEYKAFCLLGTVKPCFESASLMVFSQEEFKAQLDEMMSDFKKSVTTTPAVIEGAAKFNLDNPEGGEEELGKDNKNTGTTTFELASQFRIELRRALEAEMTERSWGETARYWLEDYDTEAMEVYAIDTEDWLLYGFSFSMNGDTVVIDFDSKRRKRFAIVDFDSGAEADELVSVFAEMYSLISEKYTEKETEWEEKYQTATDGTAALKDELNELRTYKADVEKQTNKLERESVFEQFNDLSGVDEFETLRNDCEKYSIEELTEKCFAVRGKNVANKFSLQEPAAPKLPVESIDTQSAKSNKPYNGVFEHYGIGQSKL